MKKRKFLSVFAILIIAVFALSACFFSACKGGDKEDDNPDGGTEQGGGNPGTDTDIPGGGNENTRSGDTLTGDEDIIGTWNGDVEIRAELSGTGYGGTIPAEMNAEITAESFILAFTPSDIVYDSIVYILEGLDEFVTQMLADNGIAVGEEFVMFENFPVLVDDEGFFADIDGDWVKCQLPLELNEDGQLLISFSETMAFENYDIDIKFDAVLDSDDYVEMERENYVIDVATASDSTKYLKFTLDDGTSVTFANNTYDIDITTRNGKNYTVNGTSSEMDADMARWFGGSAQEGDQYVVIKVKVDEGETISYTSDGGTKEKSYTNTGDNDPDFDDGYFFIIYKLNFDGNGVCTSKGEYTITAADGTETVYTVSFSGVTVYSVAVTISVNDEIVTSLIMEVGQELTFVGNAVNSDGSPHLFYTGSAWEPSASNVVSVVQGKKGSLFKATVTALAVGVEAVTFTLSTGETASCTVTVVDPLVSAYEGEGVTLGSDSTSVTYANGSSLTLTMLQDASGEYNDYTVSGTATVMSEEQIAAYNAVYTDDQAVDGDAYIVLEIRADGGSTVIYGGRTYTVEENGTSVAVVQKISAIGATAAVNVTISSGSETTASFTIDFDGVGIPDTALVGVWSNPSINATALGIFSATASVELTVNEDGTYKLTISNISAYGYDLSSLVDVIEMEGTWTGSDGTYILTGSGGNSVTVVMSEDGQSVSMSFSISVSGISITVTNETLTSGPLETSEYGGEE